MSVLYLLCIEESGDGITGSRSHNEAELESKDSSFYPKAHFLLTVVFHYWALVINTN